MKFKVTLIYISIFMATFFVAILFLKKFIPHHHSTWPFTQMVALKSYLDEVKIGNPKINLELEVNKQVEEIVKNKLFSSDHLVVIENFQGRWKVLYFKVKSKYEIFSDWILPNSSAYLIMIVESDKNYITAIKTDGTLEVIRI